MWPTFFIPYVEMPEFISGSPAEVCGTASGASISIPNPSPIAVGATQLLIIDLKYSAGATLTLPDQTDPAWRRIFNGDRVARTSPAVYGEGNQYMFWRVYSAGATNATISVSTGSVTAAYTSVVLNNPNTTDRWFSAHVTQFGGSAEGNGTEYRWYGPLTGMEIARSGDLALWCSAPGGGWSSSNEPATADVEFSCTPTFVAAGSGANGHTVAGISTYAKTANNLLQSCPLIDPAYWTIVGLTRATDVVLGTECRVPAFFTNNTGTGQHYIEQSVTLEAGKTYLYAVTWMAYDATNPHPWGWMTYVKPDTTEHGFGFDAVGNVAAVTGSTEVVWGGAGRPGFSHGVVGDNTSGFFGDESTMLIKPDTTGTYKIRFYITPSSAVQPSASYDTVANLGSLDRARQWFGISGMLLQEGPSTDQIASYVETTATAAAKGTVPGVLFPIAKFTTGAGSGVYKGSTVIIARRAGGIRPSCRLFAPRLKGVSLGFSDFTITDTYERHDNNERGYQALGTTHVVHDQLPSTKFYCELYVNSFGTGAADDAYSVGACAFAGLQDSYNVTTKVGDYVGQYAYMSTGKTWTDGTQDGGTVTGWSVGDYIGVGIDFTNWQVTFYRNGTLLKTQTITNDYDKYTLWMAQFGIRGPGTGDKQARFTYNFTGPFSGRKPAGFVAYDFDNEIP